MYISEFDNLSQSIFTLIRMRKSVCKKNLYDFLRQPINIKKIPDFPDVNLFFFTLAEIYLGKIIDKHLAPRLYGKSVLFTKNSFKIV